jgi:hypothetical protein
MRCMVRSVKALPAVVREKREAARQKSDHKKREKAEEKKRIWEDKVKTAEEAKLPDGNGEDAVPAPA